MRRSYRITVSVLTFLVLCVSGATQVARRTFALEAQDPAFWNLMSRDTKLETIASGFSFTEGPVWDPSGFLYVSDEKGNKIYRVYPSGRKEEVIAIGDPDGNTLDPQHRLIDCSSVLRAVVEITPAGKYNMLANSYEGKKLNTPNDVTVGPDGALYFTDPNMDLARGETQELPFQGVYRLDKKGELMLLAKDLSEPNGLAFSPDGKHFYVDDSEQKNIRVYDVAPNGMLANGRIFGAEPGGHDEGVPDGIKVDMDGNVYVTGPKGIWVWNANGQHIGTITLPEQPANLAWGDNDYGALYITATTSVYRLRTKVAGYVPYSKSRTQSGKPGHEIPQQYLNLAPFPLSTRIWEWLAILSSEK